MNELYIWNNPSMTKLYVSALKPVGDDCIGLCQLKNFELLKWIQDNKPLHPFILPRRLKELNNKIKDNTLGSEVFEIANSLLISAQIRLHGQLEDARSLWDLAQTWIASEEIEANIQSFSEQKIRESSLPGRTWFVHPSNQLALHFPKPHLNLNGQELAEISSADLPIVVKDWEAKAIGRGLWVLKAKRLAFVGWKSDQGLTLLDFNRVNSWNTHLYCFAPLLFNDVECQSWLQDKQNAQSPLDPNLVEALTASRGRMYVLREGILPVLSEDERIELNPRLVPKIEAIDNRIDFKQCGPYRELTSGEWIATRYPPKIGVPGMDLNGREIPVTQPQSRSFRLEGNTVVRNEEDGRVFYHAPDICIARIIDNGLQITPNLVLHEDIGLRTGNISFSKNMEIRGDIQSGFQIECGGNLILHQTPSPGSILKVGGNLICKQGILGKETLVDVGGNFCCQFIEDASITVKGHAYIIKSAVNAKIYADGYLVVEGRNQIDTRKGAVIGGVGNGALGVWIHSISSEIGQAQVFAGLSLSMERKLADLERRHSEIGNKIAELYKKSRTLQAEKAADRLSNRDQIVLNQIMDHSASLSKMRMELDRKINHLAQEVETIRDSQSPIYVSKFILPNVNLQVESFSLEFRQARTFVSPVAFKTYRNYLLEFPEPEAAKPPIPEPT